MLVKEEVKNHKFPTKPSPKIMRNALSFEVVMQRGGVGWGGVGGGGVGGGGGGGGGEREEIGGLI